MEESFEDMLKDIQKSVNASDEKENVEFNVSKWEKDQDKRNIEWIMKNCQKGCTKEYITKEEAECYYNECIKEEILYHHPEDSETLWNYIRAYNFFKKWE